MADVDAILARAAGAALAGRRDDEVFSVVCEELAAAGIPLLRGTYVTDFLHPTLEARVLVWLRGKGLSTQTVDRLPENAPLPESWLRSPLHRLVEQRQTILRCRIEPESIATYPVLAEVAELGGVDYLAMRQPIGRGASFGEVEEVLTSWVTDRPGGFTDEHVALLQRLHPYLVLAVATVSNVWIARALLETYLGRDAARRVLAGNVVRGRAETTRRVIWYSDLSGFTRLTDTLPRSEILGLLNDYSEPIVDAITGEGGEVLKFMGDGMLAIFGHDQPEEACGSALRAWSRAHAATDRVSQTRAERGAAVTRPYLALHEGEVLYGNFGGRARLDFTVLGPAVNEAARIAAMCRSLDQRLIVSDAFAGTCGSLRNRLVGLGRYALRGVARPQMLWTVDPVEA